MNDARPWMGLRAHEQLKLASEILRYAPILPGSLGDDRRGIDCQKAKEQVRRGDETACVPERLVVSHGDNVFGIEIKRS